MKVGDLVESCVYRDSNIGVIIAMATSETAKVLWSGLSETFTESLFHLIVVNESR
jgi:hypothetical protein